MGAINNIFLRDTELNIKCTMKIKWAVFCLVLFLGLICIQAGHDYIEKRVSLFAFYICYSWAIMALLFWNKLREEHNKLLDEYFVLKLEN